MTEPERVARDGAERDARDVVAERDGVALVRLRDVDRATLAEHDDGAYAVDPDDRPLPREPEVHRLGIVDAATGELVGQLNWHLTGHGRTLACAAWGVGMGLLPPARGRGIGPVATRLLVEHLFATTEVDRVQASTDVDNVAAQRVLTKAGLRAEGVLRGAQLRGGRRRDLVGFAVLRSDLSCPADGGDDGDGDGDDDQPRRVLIERDGVALAELRDGERELVGAAAGDHAFALDSDLRPRPTWRPTLPPTGCRAAVLSTEDNRVLGIVSWHVVDYGGTLGCSAWNIGILLVPRARGRGVGSTAQRLVAEHLFATTELDRVEAGTDVDNVAEQRALARAGFRAEGVLRGAQLRGGRRRDMMVFGVLRTDLADPTDSADPAGAG